MDTNSSSEYGIINAMASAAMMRSVHHVPMMIGSMMTKKIMTAPSGRIMNASTSTSTIHGIVRQRSRPPKKVITILSM